MLKNRSEANEITAPLIVAFPTFCGIDSVEKTKIKAGISLDKPLAISNVPPKE